MGWRILFFSEPSKISLVYNNVVVEKDGRKALFLSLSDIDAVVIENRQISITSALLGRFASEKISLIVVDEHHQPSGILNPIGANVRHAQFAKAQLLFPEEKKAALWQSIIHQKITNQAKALEFFGHEKESKELFNISEAIAIDNAIQTEGYAASLHFKTLFPKLIRKSMEIDARNDALNYGYAVLRAAILRSIAASGLLPAVGIWHSSDLNPGNLADDIIEPFRPIVDVVVREMFAEKPDQPTIYKTEKLKLVGILQEKILIDGKALSVSDAIGVCVDSLRKCYISCENVLKLPKIEGFR
ncbi:type II CRISPR-associated endonuclease Cas1 [Sulfuricurvum sp. IAE1]|uniref:type II CRISPR-associated endonuclease Cas1 n=1 Tax=Sulfuricurvum sp. IAE1 TaxID=2546102 RepID=UPI0010472940|nr:type II CRISPR-associated endonuclease Cas1 [Sulfuricurvum sp. IAE1]TDA63619.1 type II CRISPR-associated endonuclease Cas1 [Sulfuricurvum sp. IAE1]